MRQILPMRPPNKGLTGHWVESIRFEPGKREPEVKEIRSATALKDHLARIDGNYRVRLA
jgi:hypothetical protein